MRRGRPRGFTLVELIIALSIVAALLVIMFGGLRLGLAAWRQGEDRAEVLQHGRGLNQLITRALAGTHPYLTAASATEPARILFEGEAERLAFVTATPPFPAPVPIAFTAVTFSLDAGPAAALAIRQKVLPNADAFKGVAPVLVDETVTAVRFRYLRDAAGTWEDRWDATSQKALPRAVEITLTTERNGRRTKQPPIIVSLQTLAP